MIPISFRTCLNHSQSAHVINYPVFPLTKNIQAPDLICSQPCEPTSTKLTQRSKDLLFWRRSCVTHLGTIIDIFTDKTLLASQWSELRLTIGHMTKQTCYETPEIGVQPL